MSATRDAAIRTLEGLCKEARRLAETEPLLGPDFQSWRERTLAALAEIFGDPSAERAEFARIHFEQDPRVYDAAAKAIVEQAAKTGEDITELKIPLAAGQQHFYQERLAEAAELLLSYIVMLRA